MTKPDVPENLGQFLAGQRIENTTYEILALQDEKCKILKRMVYTQEDAAAFIAAIHKGYRANWYAYRLEPVFPRD